MKTLTYKIAVSVALCGLTLVAADSVPAEGTTKKPCCVEEKPAKPLSNLSVYQLDSTWTNDAAKPFKLSALAGRPQVVTMFFTSCIYVCPTLVNDMKRIESALPENVRTNVGFTLITVDPERDTPAVLAAYRSRHQMPANWTLARGGSDDVLELAALLGVKYKKDARGDYAHSNLITLLNAKGEVVTQQIGLSQDPALFVASVLKAAQEVEAPAVGHSH